jgi:hypothetical protein
MWVTATSLTSIGLGFLMGGWTNLVKVGSGSLQPLTVAALLIVNGALVLCTYWFVASVVWPIRAIFEHLNAPTTAILSPAQIAAQLEQEWGRSPTAHEVAVAHLQHFSQCNEVLAGTRN